MRTNNHRASSTVLLRSASCVWVAGIRKIAQAYVNPFLLFFSVRISSHHWPADPMHARVVGSSAAV